MQETILKIEELRDDNWDGYQITTDKRTLNVAVDNGQSCCEGWGYMSSEDDLQQYIGAALLKVESVNSALNAKTEPGDIDEGTVYFVNFYTSRGMFQLAVYDSHNGYYGHSFKIIEEKEQ
jgi:hypothetical protein